MVVLCSIENCPSESFNHCAISFHELPRTPEMREKWIEVIQLSRPVNKYTRICSRHFKRADYDPRSLKSRCRRLQPEAVPSIFPGMPEWDNSESETEDESQIEEFDESNLDADVEDVDVDVDDDDEDDESGDVYDDDEDFDADDDDDDDDNNDNDNDKDEDNEKDEDGNDDETYSENYSNPIEIVDLTDNKIDQIKPQTNIQSNKIMLVSPILEINRIVDAISTVSATNNESDSGPVVTIKRFKPNSEEINTNNDPIQHISNNVMLIQPLTKKKCVKNDLSTQTNLQDHSTIHNDDNSIKPTTVCSNETFPKKNVKNNQDKVPPNKVTKTYLPSPNKATQDLLVQNQKYAKAREEHLVSKIRDLSQRLNRYIKTNRQLRSVLQLIKQCKDFDQVQQVLSINTGEIPKGLNCDSVIVVEPNNKRKLS